MKNSTMHRSNLSNERMALLAELRAQKGQSSNNAPNVYKRPSKQKELDLLWQSFKINQKEEKSPGIYLLTGFIAGALSMFLMTAVISINANSNYDISDSGIKTPKIERKLIKRTKNSKLAIVPPDKPMTSPVASSETYTIQDGDTLAGVIIRFYGKYDESKIQKIKAANNLANPNALSIGQKLIIPLD